MLENSESRLKDVEGALIALGEEQDCEPALRILRDAISTACLLPKIIVPGNALLGTTRLLANHVAIDAEAIRLWKALTDPTLSLRVVRSRRGRPRASRAGQMLKKVERESKDALIYREVITRALDKLKSASENDTRGTKSIIGMKTIRYEVAKKFDCTETYVRKAYARGERKFEAKQRLKSVVVNPLNALMRVDS
jgi:hypothetical protein